MKLTEAGIVFVIGISIGLLIPNLLGRTRGTPRVTAHPKAFFLGMVGTEFLCAV
jgi:hypothetical protein